MNVAQFEARFKKAKALVEKTRTAYYKADADGSADWLAKLNQYDDAVDAMEKLRDERRDMIEACNSLKRNYEFHVGLAKTNLKVYEEALAKKEAEYRRLLLLNM